ncbi:MAG: hypothetical protein MK239_09780, partial [Gemmatimonadetes bacterium]|nr:hypothetical protein [Gemmatimonadota bacterium]
PGHINCLARCRVFISPGPVFRGTNPSAAESIIGAGVEGRRGAAGTGNSVGLPPYTYRRAGFEPLGDFDG